MIVDDEHDVLTLLQFMLERDGHQITTGDNGVEALAMLGVEPANPAVVLPELLLLDIMMPIINGREVCLRLAASPHASRLPVVILTGQIRETREALAKASNVSSFLEKPFEPHKLREAVAKALPPASPEVRRA